jgi:hypothetical protein
MIWKRSGWLCLLCSLSLQLLVVSGCSSALFSTPNLGENQSGGIGAASSFSLPHFIATAGEISAQSAPFLGPYGVYALLASNVLTLAGASLLGKKNAEKATVIRELHNTTVDSVVQTQGLVSLATTDKTKRIVREVTGEPRVGSSQ